MKKLIWLPLAILIPLMAYLVYQKQTGRETDVKDLEGLDIAYAKSIELPLVNDSIEVLVYQYSGPDCGNTTDAEYRAVFLPDLLEDPYRNILSSRYKKLRVLTVYDSTLTNIPENKKLYYSGYGEVNTRKQVSIYEQYKYLEKDTSILKTAAYAEGIWSIEVLSYPEK
ncbi:MAG: hypothetical protein JWM14_3133 [Chitinophagaceae bacterium]|nr:hypothetical protein [Chitinophagaceae bacterium]